MRDFLSFRPMIVSYDQHQSGHSLATLRAHGINVRKTTFNPAYKNRIYQTLKDLMTHPEIELYLYDCPLLIPELRHLKYKPSARGVSFIKDKHGECTTDDFADCLAGACGMASEKIVAPLPMPVSVKFLSPALSFHHWLRN